MATNNSESETSAAAVEASTAGSNSDEIPDYLKMSALEHDQAVEKMKQDIEKEVSKQLQVGDVESVGVLRAVYAPDDVIYQNKIKEIEKSFSRIRRIRQDGNCFFRAFGFSLMEQLLNNKLEIDTIKQSLEEVKNDLIGTFGYPDMTVGDFYDNFVEVLDKLKAKDTDVSFLLQTYQDTGLSDYMVCFLRLIVSVHLQRNHDFYINFIGAMYSSLKAFLSEEVEPMCIESDHLHISAISECLNVRINVLYMDRGKEVVEHKFQEQSTFNVNVNLLYRPGHYDILYV